MDQTTKDLTLLFTDSELILQECQQLKTDLGAELDLARSRRLTQEREFREFMAELRDTLTQIQSQFRIEAQLLNLVRPAEETKEEECQKRRQNDTKKSMTQSRMLKEYAKSTH